MPNKRKVEGPYSVTLKPKFAFYACQNIALSNSPHLQTNNDFGSFGSSAGTLPIQVPRKCNINFLLMIVIPYQNKRFWELLPKGSLKRIFFLSFIKFSHLVLPGEFVCSLYFLRVKQVGTITTKSGKARLHFNSDDYPAVVVALRKQARRR